MFCLKICDSINGGLSFDLREVLHALGPEALDWTWTVSGIEERGEVLFATGDGAAELEALETSREEISGSRLLEIAESTRQVIWGEFRAFRDSQRDHPWMRIVAFDSSWFEAWCEDEAILTRLGAAFDDTTLVFS
jgi:hypothetical protein